MPINAVLNDREIEAFGQELDALRDKHLATLGERDARYIRRIHTTVRWTNLAGRALLMFGWFPPTWILGSLLLGIAKIIDNMELGHNVIHGQFDFMNDPDFSGKTFEWNNAGCSDHWRVTHNYEHHTYTNVIGKDNDIGYGLARLFPEQRWHKHYLLQPLWVLLQAILFQYAVAVQHLQVDRYWRGKMSKEEFQRRYIPFRNKILKVWFIDYLLFPLLAGPNFLAVLAGNAVANVIRNLWTFTIIFCGHFTENCEVFTASVLKNETRGEWYLRQLRGSGNLEGPKWLHILSGNLSHQIEHHFFPDLPANRYEEMAVEVRRICAKYGQHYNTGNPIRQFASVLKRIFTYGLKPRQTANA